MFTASRTDAETAVLEVAEAKAEIDPNTAPPEFRVALALAISEYGEGGDLARCLSKGVAFHHSALNSELRCLVERLASLGTLDYIAATTTLAKGMNFPVSSVVIHSVTKGMPATPLTRLARKYLADVASKDQGYMKVADQTGLASFSFDELYASIARDPVLRNGDYSTV